MDSLSRREKWIFFFIILMILHYYLVRDIDHYRYDEVVFEHVRFLDRFVLHLDPILHELQMMYKHQHILDLFL
jgi:hypothetical protein